MHCRAFIKRTRTVKIEKPRGKYKSRLPESNQRPRDAFARKFMRGV